MISIIREYVVIFHSRNSRSRNETTDRSCWHSLLQPVAEIMARRALK